MFRRFVVGAGFALCASAHAQDVQPPRQIAPDMFAPVLRDGAATPRPRPAAAPTPSPAPVPTEPPRSPIVAPTRERPLGGCERGARDWVLCLQATARLADRSVEEASSRVAASLETRDNLNPIMREEMTNALSGAQEAWRNLRDRECAMLPLIENGLGGALYEARLICRIRRDIERRETLAARYVAAP
jgi:uncharacterized protein YecT (DUF1311 family)